MLTHVDVFIQRTNCRHVCSIWIFTALLLVLLTSCVSNYPKVEMPPPWIPENLGEEMDEAELRPADDAVVPIYFSSDSRPLIDGSFDEWAGLDGPLTRLAVFGGSHIPKDAEAFFVMQTDGANLYIYARVTDDLPHENFLPGSMAWRGDTVEIFFGTNTSKHKKYLDGDNQIRLVPRSKTEVLEVDIVVNQRTVGAYMVDGQDDAVFGAAAVYNDTGYEIEAAIPLSLLTIDSLKPGGKVRCEFQVNDADGTERDRLIHWISDKDTPWFDPSVWGDGAVVPLPEIRKEIPDVL